MSTSNDATVEIDGKTYDANALMREALRGSKSGLVDLARADLAAAPERATDAEIDTALRFALGRGPASNIPTDEGDPS